LVYCFHERDCFFRKCNWLWSRCSFLVYCEFSLKSSTLLFLYCSLDVHIWIILVFVQTSILIRISYRLHRFQRSLLCCQFIHVHIWSTIPRILHSWIVPRRNCRRNTWTTQASPWRRRKWRQGSKRFYQ